MRGLFVTGTDTDIGKTVASAILAQAFSEKLPTGYFKPIQAGSLNFTDTDRVRSLTTSNVFCADSAYGLVTPASPNRAAKIDNIEISVERIIGFTKKLADRFYIVEGAGGLLVPINEQQTIADLALALDLPCAVVASTRLGTINHTLLTWNTLKLRGLSPQVLVLVGPEDPGLLATLKEQIQIPVVVEIPILDVLDQESVLAFVQSCKPLKVFVDNFFATSERPLSALDRQYVWHPFTQHKTSGQHPVVVKGRGAYLQTENGRWLIDGISSWWVNLFGHGQRQIATAIAEQAHQLEHVIFAGYTHAPAIDLLHGLVQRLNHRGCQLSRGFFSDNGSTSVEVALKMAYQFHRNRGDRQRTKFLALANSYHGDTLGAMSVGGRGTYFTPFEPLMFPVTYVDPANEEAIVQTLNRHGHEYAAIIFEPLVQGAAGMKMHSPAFLDRLASQCKKLGILLIADEIFTGFYRTGKMFAFEHCQLRPDLLCLSKGLTGGFLPLAVTLTTEDIFQAFHGDSMQEAFLHGHSYTANPIACRAAVMTLELLAQPQWLDKIATLSTLTQQHINAIAEQPWAQNPRALGTIGAFEVGGQKNFFSQDFARKMSESARELGILLRPLGHTVYVCPPYCISERELNFIYSGITKILTGWEEK